MTAATNLSILKVACLNGNKLMHKLITEREC